MTTRLECISGALAAVALAGVFGCEQATPGQTIQPPGSAAQEAPAAASATPAVQSTSATPAVQSTTPAVNASADAEDSAPGQSSRTSGHHADRDSRERVER